MNDTDLSELVRKFHAIQRQEVPNQITERNVIEIINVLRKRKLVDLLYTLDGKEYLTWDQLRREIVDELLANGGRMNVVDLPGSLNVHVTCIERVLPEILEDPTIRTEGGELMTDEYLDTTIQSAAEVLKEQGSLAVVDFAKTHRFSSIFAQELLTKAVQSRRLCAVVEGNAIYTTQFVRSQQVILRAGLMAATRPVNLTTFFERHNLFLPLMDCVVEAVCAELPGKVDGRVYVPHYFEFTRAEQVENIYLSNGFIEYAALQRQGISQAKEFLLAKYNPVAEGPTPSSVAEVSRGRARRHQTANAVVDAAPVVRTETHPNAGHALSNCFVADRFLANLVVFEDLTHRDTLALDLALHLPCAINFERDFNKLLGRLRELHPVLSSCVVLDGGVFVHESALGQVRERLRTVFEGSLKQRKKQGRKKVSEHTVFGEEEEEMLLDVVSSVTGLSREEYEGSLQELSSLWNDVARDVYLELTAAMEQNSSADLKRMRLKLQASLDAAWIDMFIVAKGVAWTMSQLDEATSTAVNRHVLTTRALPMVRDILLNESLDAAELYERVADVLAPEQPTAALLQKALKTFQKTQSQALLPLVEAANGKSVENFVNLLQELCSSGQIAISTFHQPNKKTEREAFTALKTRLVERIEQESFTADVAHSGALFALVCSLLVHTHFRVHVELPGRAVGGVVTRLLKEMVVPVVGDFQECYKCVMGAISGNELNAESLERLEHFRRRLLEEVS